MANCGYTCTKYLLFVFNLIIWITGAVLLGVGIWFLVDPSALHYLQIANVSTSSGLAQVASITLVAVGAMLFVVGGLGWCGACRENSCCLTMFSIILFLLLVVQIVAGIMAGVFHSKIAQDLQGSMNTTVLHRYGMKQHEVETDAWDFMQTEMKCCGVKSPLDWEQSYYVENVTKHIPNTCCTLKNTDYKHPQPVDEKLCHRSAFDESFKNRTAYIHIEGCEEVLEDWLNTHIGILIGVAVGLVAVEIVAIVLACSIMNNKRREYEYV